MTLGSCSCAAVVLHSSLTDLSKHAVHLTAVTKTKVVETVSEILVADSDYGSSAEASDVEGEEEEQHQKQTSAED